MARALKVGTPYVMWHGVLVLCLGATLFNLAALMTNPRTEALDYALSAILTAACLVAPSVIAFMQVSANGSWRRRRFLIGLLAGIASLALWLALWLSQPEPLNIHFIVLLAGLHGLFWGMWLLGLAFHLQAYPRKAALLCVLAGTTSAAGLILAAQTGITEAIAVTAVACYTTCIGVQLLLIVPYLFRILESPGTVEQLRTCRPAMSAK